MVEAEVLDAVEVETAPVASLVDEEPQEPIHVSAIQGRMTASAVLPLVDDEALKEGGDLLVNALSALAGLGHGQQAIISVSIRRKNDYKAFAAKWLRYMRGETSRPAQGLKGAASLIGLLLRIVLMVLKGIVWLVRRLVYESRGRGKAPQMGMGSDHSSSPRPQSHMSEEERDRLREAEKKAMDQAHFETALYIAVVGDPYDQPALDGLRWDIQNGMSSFQTRHQQLYWDESDGLRALLGFMPPRADDRLLLSAGELGCLARVPDDLTRPQAVQVIRNRVKQLKPHHILTVPDPRHPVVTDRFGREQALIPVGVLDRGSEDERVVGFSSSDLDKHCYFCGTTGTGKSELMQWLILGSIKDPARRCIVVFDPHGELIIDTIYNIVAAAPERIDDVLIADLSDADYPVAINPLDISSASQVEGRVGQVMEMVFAQLNVSEDSAPRGVPLIQMALTALCEANVYLPADSKLTLLQVPAFFADAQFRELVVSFSTNEGVQAKFGIEGEFSKMKEAQQAEQAAVPNRVFSKFTNSDAFAAVFGASQDRLSYRDALADRRILLVSAGGMSENKQLGEFVSQLGLPQLVSASGQLGRKKDLLGAESGEDKGVRVFVDEAPAVIKQSSTSAKKVLAEMRKRDFGLTLTSQYLDQFDSSLQKDIMVNTQTKFSLRTPPADAKKMTDAMSPEGTITAADVAFLPNYTMYANVQLPGGQHSGTFAAATVPPGDREQTPERVELVRQIQQRSRATLCNRREDILRQRTGHLDRVKNALTQALVTKERGGPVVEAVPADRPVSASSPVETYPVGDSVPAPTNLPEAGGNQTTLGDPEALIEVKADSALGKTLVREGQEPGVVPVEAVEQALGIDFEQHSASFDQALQRAGGETDGHRDEERPAIEDLQSQTEDGKDKDELTDFLDSL
jgi:hypothetical protein